MTDFELYYNSIWEKVTSEVAQIRNFDEIILNTYYKSSKLASLNDNKAVIVVENTITKQVLIGDISSIIEAFEIVQKRKLSVDVLLKSEFVPNQPTQSFNYSNYTQSATSQILNYNNIKPEFTFQNFIVGSSNRESHAAALGTAYSPGNMYNPLFIFGNSGLGKTHLLYSIGNFIINENATKKVYYTSSNDFVEKVTSCIMKNTINQLKAELYEIDVLLMDDIQFLADKVKSHEVFFSLYNELISKGKQIVITSDRHPTEIKGLEDRLISRFTSGLSVGLDSPEFETAVAILRLKIEQQVGPDVQIDEDVITYMAQNCAKDVRYLEGSVKRLLFYSIQFSQGSDHIDLPLAIEALKVHINGNTTSSSEDLSINMIKKQVADFYGLTKQQLISKTRTSKIANARQIAMYLCRKLLDTPFVKIGEEFGKRDHSTVMSACKKVEDTMKKDSMFQKAVKDLEKNISTK